MLRAGPAKRVIIHLNEDVSSRNDFLYVEVFSLLWQRGVAGASLIRPQAGFCSHHQVHDASTPGDQEHMPVRIDFVETPENVALLLPDLARLVVEWLMEVQETTIYTTVEHIPDAEGGI